MAKSEQQNRKGFASLDAHIKKLRTLGEIPERVAPKVAVSAKQEISRNASQQRGPDGRPWPKGKKGQAVLVGAGNAVRASAVGSVVVLSLDGHYARHHLGAVKGKTKREILPNKRIPQTMTRAITRVVTGEFFAIMGPDTRK